jgi:nicotinate phosphoribosyltransferase
MPMPTDLYRPSLALLTDLYQITMAYAAWRTGVADREAVFHLFFRKTPFDGGFAVACGLEHAVDYLARVRVDDDDLAYLAQLAGEDGKPMFEREFLAALRDMPGQLDVDGIPEGTVVFPQEPLVRVRGPIIPCMLAESLLLNIVNFQTLVATKAARIVHATRGEPVLEFGLRRAQGIDGALTASRAAYVGGCAATSNVLAGRLYGIPVRGTHAHSWVMLFDDEREAFASYARALPGNCTFLVDTYDTLAGVRNAIAIGRTLREHGFEMHGVRLDSGDLAYLSIEARRVLDEAGFQRTKILATNDLDEHVIASLKEQGAPIAVWGVGTRLITGHDDAALGGVYKLSAVRRPGEAWQHRVKLSEQVAKISTPGVLQVRRFSRGAELVADGIFDQERGWPASVEQTIVDPIDPTRKKRIPDGATHEDLLVPALRGGKPAYAPPPLAAIRERALAEVARLAPGVKRTLHPHQHPVGLEPSLHELRTRLILQARRGEAR